jgi:hypothetical protein
MKLVGKLQEQWMVVVEQIQIQSIIKYDKYKIQSKCSSLFYNLNPSFFKYPLFEIINLI